MRSPREDLFPSIAQALASRGWAPSPSEHGVEFKIVEPVKGGRFEITLRFDPKRNWLIPQATVHIVEGAPSGFRWHRIGQTLCYLDRESVEWDPESPQFISHVVWAAERAVDELHRLQKGQTIAEDDIEFPVHWLGAPVYLDIATASWPPPLGSRLERLDLPRPECFSEVLSVFRLAGSSGADRYAAFKERKSTMLVPPVFVELTQFPRPLDGKDAWPPNNLAQLNIWLHAHQPTKGSQIWGDLAEALLVDRAKRAIALMVIESQAGRFGALVLAGDRALDGFRKGRQLAEQLKGRNLLTRAIQIKRFRFERLEDDFVLKRNQPDGLPPLADKRIHLIGVGAIGSTLADRLVQAGAGMGKGSLHLFDFDILRTENLGRHLLGVPYLDLPKVEGVAAYLRRNRLATNVIAHPVSGTDPSCHEGADLVIDATGAPYVGAALSNATRSERKWPVMWIFLEGQGWVAGCYLYQGLPREACRTCLEPWVDGAGGHVHKADVLPPTSNGCGGSYTPYRAAAIIAI